MKDHDIYTNTYVGNRNKCSEPRIKVQQLLTPFRTTALLPTVRWPNLSKLKRIISWRKRLKKLCVHTAAVHPVSWYHARQHTPPDDFQALRTSNPPPPHLSLPRQRGGQRENRRQMRLKGGIYLDENFPPQKTTISSRVPPSFFGETRLGNIISRVCGIS